MHILVNLVLSAPQIAVCIVGIILAGTRLPQLRTAGYFALMGFGIVLGMRLLHAFNIFGLFFQAVPIADMGSPYLLIMFFQFIEVTAIVLLLLAVFSERQAPPAQAPWMTTSAPSNVPPVRPQ